MMDPRIWERRLQRAAHPLAQPALSLLVGDRPVRRVPRLGVVVADPVLARDVLCDTEHFSKVGPGSPADLWTPVVGPRVLLNMDGADHAALRRSLGPLFTPRAVREVCSAAGGSVVRGFRSRLRAGGEVDLVRESVELATAVIGVLVGLPADAAGRHWARRAVAAASEVTGLIRLRRPRLTDRQVVRARTAMSGLTEPARAAWLAGGDTVPGRMRSLGLSEDEAVGAVAAFVLVGTETLVSYLPRLIALCVDTGWLHLLAADDALRDKVIGEALRFTVPSPVMLRSTVEPTSVGPVAARRGDRIIVATAMACAGQTRFDPTSAAATDLRQLWFGAGPHFCLGMPLAHAEIDLMLDAVVRQVRSDGRLRIVRRAARRGTLIPRYAELVVAHG